MSLFKRFFSDINHSEYVLTNFVNQDMTVKYKRSLLGFFWSLINPLAMMAISAVVFGSIMRFDLKDFVVFLFAAMLPWSFFSTSIDFCGISILNAESFIKKVYIPKLIFPLSTICSQFLNMLFSMAALFIIMLILGAQISLALTFLPVSFLILFVFTMGISLIMATANVYFRDARYLMGIILNAGYYLTPILYPIERIPETLRTFFKLNPMYYIVELFRAPIYRAEFPSFQMTGISVLLAAVSFLMGLFIFYRYEKDFVYRL